jgi:hypothetical protein
MTDDPFYYLQLLTSIHFPQKDLIINPFSKSLAGSNVHT